MPENENITLLNSIYQTSQMGFEALQALLPKVQSQSRRFCQELQGQTKRYRQFGRQARALLYDYQQKPKRISAATQFSLRTALATHTVFDRSPSRLAELVIHGSTMGMIDMAKRLRQCSGCSQSIADLGQDLLQFESDAIEQMKPYL